MAQMMAQFAPALLRHLRHPDYQPSKPDSAEDLRPLRQVWLANDTHLDMLHQLEYAFARTQHGGAQRPVLNALGRACGWLFRESQRPGQMAVIVAAQALREAYTFPAETIRQQHLGYLLAWLETDGDYAARLTNASQAERQSTSTTLDPQFERAGLDDWVARWGAAARVGEAADMQRWSSRIDTVIREELQRRHDLLVNSLVRLRSDPRAVNQGVATLVRATVQEQWLQYTRLELNRDDELDGPAFFPAAETDRHPAAAASRYLVHQAAAELVEGLLVHDDAELLAEAIAAGDAFQGNIRAAHEASDGRSTRPVWTIQDAANRQLRLRIESRVSVVGFPERHGVITGIRPAGDGTLLIDVELKGRKTDRQPGPGLHAFAPTDARSLVGRSVAFVTRAADEISRTKSRRVWQQQGPGAWLTHAVPGTRFPHPGEEDEAPEPDDALVVDQALRRTREATP
ncbi:MAG: hypothetical protein K1X74_17410 [Pirellulales bacterium]|nr:hypothetical protein [Pirellulales bacterium]